MFEFTQYGRSGKYNTAGFFWGGWNGGFNTGPFIYNEGIASSSTEEILAHSNPLTNNVCSFVIPGQGSPDDVFRVT